MVVLVGGGSPKLIVSNLVQGGPIPVLGCPLEGPRCADREAGPTYGAPSHLTVDLAAPAQRRSRSPGQPRNDRKMVRPTACCWSGPPAPRPHHHHHPRPHHDVGGCHRLVGGQGPLGDTTLSVVVLVVRARWTEHTVPDGDHPYHPPFTGPSAGQLVTILCPRMVSGFWK